MVCNDFQSNGFRHNADDFPATSSSSDSTSLPESNDSAINYLEPIAIVGMGCRLPGDVSSPSGLWDLIMSKRIANSAKVPSSRFNIESYLHPNNERPGSIPVSGGYYLEGTNQEFDATAFGISPVEALWMEPQQKKLLEVVYEAFESCGVTPEQVAGSVTGCYIGNFVADYQQMIFKEPDFRHSYAATGIDPGLCSNRISNAFNLTGPSMVLNTACSSQMYALHTACTALRNNDCEAAVVGGTNLILTVDQHMNTAKLGVLSPTNQCHAFDASADGYGRGEGVGALYIKRLGDALRDGNPVRAVIRSTAVNSNGKVPEAGITSPSIQGQAAVICAAQKRANLDPNLTAYIECHGTGTAVGDPVEARAISLALRGEAVSKQPIMIGSVKPNVGHSEAASSIPTIIKSVLAVERGIIPPTAGIITPNPNIKWDDWEVKLVVEPTLFPTLSPLRRIGVNAFGYGGTNAHCILENVDNLVQKYDGHKSLINESSNTPETDTISSKADRRTHLFVFSAHDKATLARNIMAYHSMKYEPQAIDLSYTLALRRAKHKYRAFAISKDNFIRSALINALDTATEERLPMNICFAFTGQGAQWPTMGATLFDQYPVFAQTIRDLDSALAHLAVPPSWTIQGSLIEPADKSRVDEPEFSQPLCTAIQIGVVNLLNSWAVVPKVTVGHSSGEIAAAYAAGFLSADDAIIAAYYRGKSMTAITGSGAMLAVGLGAEDVIPYLTGCTTGKVVIGCHNSPRSVTLSGDASAIHELNALFASERIFARILKTGGKAYHSFHMEEVSVAYEKYLEGTPLRKWQKRGDCKMISSVTSTAVADGTINSKYWISNLTSPVLFNQALSKTLAEDPELSVVVEIGPHSALKGPIRDICAGLEKTKIQYFPTLLRSQKGTEQLLSLAGSLWSRSDSIDIKSTIKVETMSNGIVEEVKPTLLVDLPTYQWNYSKNTWMEPRQSREHRTQSQPRHDVLGRRIQGLSPLEPSWQNVLRHKDLPWLKDHSLGGEAVLPASAYFAMAFEALSQINNEAAEPAPVTGFKLDSISISNALVIPNDAEGIATVYSMSPQGASAGALKNSTEQQVFRFSVSSWSNDIWTTHMTGNIQLNPRKKGRKPEPVPELGKSDSGKSWYQCLDDVGFHYGSSFQLLSGISSNGSSHIGVANSAIERECRLVEGGESRYFVHPTSIDSCLQLIMVAIYAGKINDVTCGMTFSTSREISVWVPSAEQVKTRAAKAHAWTTKQGQRVFLANSQLVADDGQLIIDMVDVKCTSYEAAVPTESKINEARHPYSKLEWKEDVDYLQYSTAQSAISTKGFLDLLFHKTSAPTILDLDSVLTPDLLGSHKTGDLTIVAKDEERSQASQELWYSYKNANVVIEDVKGDFKQQDGSFYDAFICSKVSESRSQFLARVQNIVKPGSLLQLSETEDFLAITTRSPLEDLKDFTSHNVLVYRTKPNVHFEYIQQAFILHGHKVRTSSLEALQVESHERIIMLADLEGPLLETLQDDELKSLKILIGTTKSIIWVTPGGLLTGKNPEYSMSNGLARTLAVENLSLDLITVDFDLESCSAALIKNFLLDVSERQVSKKSGEENEYLVSDDKVYIGRLVPDAELNGDTEADKESLVSIRDSPPVRGILNGRKIIFEEDRRAFTQLGKDEVEIKTAAIGLNREDHQAVVGNDYLHSFSHEVAGIVTAAGSDVLHPRVGDRVTGFCFDNLATYQRTLATLVQRIPDDAVLDEMATIPMAYATALYGLQDLARVNPGETVLILDGGAATLAALQFCRAIRAQTIIVTASTHSRSKLQAIGICEQIISSEEGDLTTQIMIATKGRGVDTVFGSDFTEVSILSECSKSLASFGRVVTFGRRDPSRPFSSVLSSVPGYQRFAFDILDLYEQRPRVLSELLKQSLDLYAAGRVSVIKPITLKKVSETELAIRSYSDESSNGKIVISFAPDSMLKIIHTKPPLTFSSDATYLLVGCLGGLGRSLTSWMVDRGAKRLAFLSRSGTANPSAAALVKDIQELGVHVAIMRCDVTSKTDVEEALKDIDPRYPIRGVLNAAMVLDDCLFYNMTIDRWRTPIQAKVLGSRNLHEIFQSYTLDFFIMTSSVSGLIGTPGQSNYASANTYLDSLARHRRSRGLPAVSLILPPILGVGYVSEHQEIEEMLRKRGLYGINEDELLAAFEVAMKPQSTGDSGSDHVVVGLDPAKLARSATADTNISWLEKSRFLTVSAMMRTSDSDQVGGGSKDNVGKRIANAKNDEEAVVAVAGCLVSKLSEMLMIDEAGFVSQTKSIVSYGLDSMIGADFRNWIFREFKLDMSFQELLSQSLTVTRLAGQLLAEYRRVL